MKIALVATVRQPGPSFASFLGYHASLGFAPIYLFFDDPADASIAEARCHPAVRVIPCDALLRARWQASADELALAEREVMCRQILNVNLALAWAVDDGVDWLLHLDADEAFHPGGESLAEHFAGLDRAGYPCAQYLNLEVVPERDDLADYFREATLFKKNPVEIRSSIMSDEARRARTATIPQLPESFFFYYSNGKSAVRVAPAVRAAGCHGFQAGGRGLRTHVSLRPAVLHYMNAGFDNFARRYRLWGDFPDRWFGSVDIRSHIGDFHTDARDAAQALSPAELRAFYRERLVLGDAAHKAELEANGLCVRIPDVADALRSRA